MYAILPLYLGRTPQPLKGEYYKQKTYNYELLAILLALMGALRIQAETFDVPVINNDTFWKTVTGDYIFSQGGGIFRFPDPKTDEEHYIGMV